MTDTIYSDVGPAGRSIGGVRVSGTKASSGDNELVAAPGAGIRIVVKAWHVQNESSAATTFILKDGSSSEYRYLAQNQGDGHGRVYEQDFEWRLAANSALNLNLSGANSHGYWLEYWTEAA